MPDGLVQKAINAALKQSWEEAALINEKILKENQKDLEALNRLGRAYLELGKPELAKKSFNEALKVDPYNQISLRNIKILGSGVPHLCQTYKTPLDPNLFLEEPGKTKATTLIDIASKEILLSLSVGEEVKLEPRKRFVVVASNAGTYVGKLSDDLSQRLLIYMNGGNKYQAYVKCTTATEIKILIKEVSRSKKFADQPTFPPQELSYQAFVSPDIIHESRPVVTTSENDDDKSDDFSESEESEAPENDDEDA